jgi:hypothetical protein
LEENPARESHTTSKISVKDSSGSSFEHAPSPNSFSYSWRPEALRSSPDDPKEEINASEKDEGSQGKQRKPNSDNDDEEFIGLPRWQKDFISKDKKENPKSSTSSSSTSSSSSSSYGKESFSKSQYSVQQHSWQSALHESSTIERSKSALSTKKKDKRSPDVKHVTFCMDDSESDSQESKTKSEDITETNDDINPSLSPSSIDGQKALGKSVITSDKETANSSGPMCTQPDMSEDLFRPSSFSTQESTQEKDMKNLQDKTSTGRVTTKEIIFVKCLLWFEWGFYSKLSV